MGVYVKEEAIDLTIPEDATVRARLEEVVEHTFEWEDKKKSPPEPRVSTVLKWWWVVTEGEYAGRKVMGQCDNTINSHQRNRFNQWAEALLDRTIPIGMPIDTEDLVGLSADLSIKHETDKKDPTKVYERVYDVRPIQGGSDSNSWGSEPPF